MVRNKGDNSTYVSMVGDVFTVFSLLVSVRYEIFMCCWNTVVWKMHFHSIRVVRQIYNLSFFNPLGTMCSLDTLEDPSGVPRGNYCVNTVGYSTLCFLPAQVRHKNIFKTANELY